MYRVLQSTIITWVARLRSNLVKFLSSPCLTILLTRLRQLDLMLQKISAALIFSCMPPRVGTAKPLICELQPTISLWTTKTLHLEKAFRDPTPTADRIGALGIRYRNLTNQKNSSSDTKLRTNLHLAIQAAGSFGTEHPGQPRAIHTLISNALSTVWAIISQNPSTNFCYATMMDVLKNQRPSTTQVTNDF